jgi:hypothetical protein
MKAVYVALSLLFIHWSTSQVLTVEPKTDIFVTPQVVGSDVSASFAAYKSAPSFISNEEL